MEVHDIEMIPGFELIEHSPGSTTIKIPSGFTLKIRRVGPYLFEATDLPEDKDPGPYLINVTLLGKLQPPGIEVEQIYEQPDEIPDPEEHPKAWAYYQGWRVWELRRRDIAMRRGARRLNIALLNCVEIVTGPMSMDDDKWIDNLSELSGVPSNKTERLLMFYKTQVITTQNTRDIINALWTVEEVKVEGLKKALDNFLSQLEWTEAFRSNG
jgi:hypothetical protein